MIDLVLAYRPNGSCVGIRTQYDYVNSVAASDKLQGDDLNEARSVTCFGALAAPQQGQVNIRPVILAKAFNVPQETADDALELVNEIGGSDTGFQVAEMLAEYSDFDRERPPMKFSVDRPEPPADFWYVEDGKYICPTCGEENCGWMAKILAEAK